MKQSAHGVLRKEQDQFLSIPGVLRSTRSDMRIFQDFSTGMMIVRTCQSTQKICCWKDKLKAKGYE